MSNATDVKVLTTAFEQLKTTEAGRNVAQAIQDHGTTVKFGVTRKGAIAQFDPATNEITIDEGQKNASPAVLAAHLAHEGLTFNGTSRIRLMLKNYTRFTGLNPGLDFSFLIPETGRPGRLRAKKRSKCSFWGRATGTTLTAYP